MSLYIYIRHETAKQLSTYLRVPHSSFVSILKNKSCLDFDIWHQFPTKILLVLPAKCKIPSMTKINLRSDAFVS